MTGKYILWDYSYHSDLEGNNHAIHDNEDWNGGIEVEIYMNGVSVFTDEHDFPVSGHKRYFCDTVVRSTATGNLYLTKKRFLREV